jgi:hypothetical protein
MKKRAWRCDENVVFAPALVRQARGLLASGRDVEAMCQPNWLYRMENKVNWQTGRTEVSNW